MSAVFDYKERNFRITSIILTGKEIRDTNVSKFRKGQHFISYKWNITQTSMKDCQIDPL